jgi:hypothetical protein
MKLRAIRALLTIAQQPKSLAVRGCGIDPDMRKTAIVVVAASFLEMLTCRRIVWSRVV